MRTNYNDKKPINAKENDSGNISEGPENTVNVDKIENTEKALQQETNKNDDSNKNETTQQYLSIFKL